MADLNAQHLALRVQGLIHGQFGGDLTQVAGRLGIDEAALQRIVDGTDSPRLDVLSTLVRKLGVDACWLLTGEYDWEAHRRQLEDEDDDSGAEPIVRAKTLLRDRRAG